MMSSGTGKKTVNSIASSQKSNKMGGTPKTVNAASSSVKSSCKTILKHKILFPKKRKGKEKLGTDTSTLEEDQQRPSGGIPAETAVVNFGDSGSEYVPSETDGL